jgi:diphthamide synthase (EF-2-diphthine--ammonia ligase)
MYISGGKEELEQLVSIWPRGHDEAGVCMMTTKDKEPVSVMIPIPSTDLWTKLSNVGVFEVFQSRLGKTQILVEAALSAFLCATMQNMST